MQALIAFFGNAFREGTKESFGRIVALPFLFSSWALLTVGGVLEIVANKSAPIETAATLAVVGAGLFTGSKMLSLKGQSMGAPAEETPKKATNEIEEAA